MEIDDASVPMLIKAVDYYNAYLAATRRESNAFLELAETLKRKGPEREGLGKRMSKKKGSGRR